jgi:hypothetical protein
MPDLTGVLFDWEVAISVEHLDQVLGALAEMHGYPWRTSGDVGDGPWCPLRERITLICRASLERPGPARDAVAQRLLPGWDAWDRLASPHARSIIAELGADPQPLVDVLRARPSTLIHGDLKLANVGIEADGSVVLVDWQMVSIAPVAIELGWFLVSNVNALPVPAEAALERYREAFALRSNASLVDWQAQTDCAVLVGLLLRGWRKGEDAAAGTVLASGLTAADDLAWWCERALEAAERTL